MRKWKSELETPSGQMKTWLQWKDANWSGTGTSHDHLDWPRLSYRDSRRKTKRQTEETMGRQHQRVDGPWMEYTTTESREPWGVEEAGCKMYNGVPNGQPDYRMDKIRRNDLPLHSDLTCSRGGSSSRGAGRSPDRLPVLHKLLDVRKGDVWGHHAQTFSKVGLHALWKLLTCLWFSTLCQWKVPVDNNVVRVVSGRYMLTTL